MEKFPTLLPGRYRHYKGQEYRVIGVGLHTETLEPMVLYQALYSSPDFGNNALWARPLSMFIESVHYENVSVPRFVYIGQ